MSLLNKTSVPPESAALPNKETFVNRTGAKLPRVGAKVQKLSESKTSYVKLLAFGPYGSGKTYFLEGLLQEGLRLLVITTDIGGDGLNSVRVPLHEQGLDYLGDNLYHVVLPTYEEVDLFLKSPEVIWPDIYDTELDMIVWDGFSGFQLFQLPEWVTENANIRDGNGNIITLQLWGAIKNETVRMMSRFLYLYNRKTGKQWHKLVTCLDSLSATDETVGTANAKKEVSAPMVQGSAQKLMGPAFDVMFETRKVLKKDGDGKLVSEYQFLTQQTRTRKVKTRGVKLDPIEPGDSRALWRKITSQLGIAAGPSEGEVAA